MKFVPTYVPQLIEMFRGVAVDGLAACIPGSSPQILDDEEAGLDVEEGGEQEEEEFVGSPASSSSCKRTSSTVDTASSPNKKRKSPLMKMFQGLLTELQVNMANEQQALTEMAKQREEELEKRHQLRKKELQERQHLRHEMRNKLKDEAREDIKNCLTLVKEAGAGPTSEEFVIATTLFQNEYYREVFHMVDNPEERLIWLRNTWQEYTKGYR